MKKGKFASKYWQRRRKLFNIDLKMRLVDLKYNFECDWLIELSDNKLSSNKVSNNKLSDDNNGGSSVKTNYRDTNYHSFPKFVSDWWFVSSVYRAICKEVAEAKKGSV